MEKSKSTTIEFDREVLTKLDELKVDPREPYFRLIVRLLKKGEKVDI